MLIQFTGPEKLLEVWFTPSPELLPPSAQPKGLKAVSQDSWKKMLDLVHCKVLSTVENEHVDAYMLSESSMFVFPHKLILKTCGTTTLLAGLPELLRIAAQEAGFTTGPDEGLAKPWQVFYSRKSFMFPDRQAFPHKSWPDEVTYLDQHFKNGSAYMIGKYNGDHWYLYITNPNAEEMTPPDTPQNELEDAAEQARLEAVADIPSHSSLIQNIVGSGNGIFDETLEVLMTHLDQENAKQFYMDDAKLIAEKSRRDSPDAETKSIDSGFDELPENRGHALGDVVSQHCGLNDIYPKSRYPDARVDSYIFEPCGYSANGVIPPADPSVKTTHYFNVHVTPEPHWSYASFETNVPSGQSGRDTAEILAHVVDIFKPGRFSVTLFEGRRRDVASAARASLKMDKIAGYRRTDKIVHELEGYDLVFRTFEREDFRSSNASSPRQQLSPAF